MIAINYQLVSCHFPNMNEKGWLIMNNISKFSFFVETQQNLH